MPRFTASLSDAMFDTIQARARHNLRSMSAELVFLLECALAAENEVNVGFIRTLMLAQRDLETSASE